jgi:lipopolysaccharide biosynthesis glycosyltransferase
MKKNCVIVINAFPDFEFCQNSIESIRGASKRWGSTFIEINELSSLASYPLGRRLFETRIDLISFYKDFDTILILDSDIIINSKAPNIFELLGESELAGVRDGNPTRGVCGSTIKSMYSLDISNLLDFDSFKGKVEIDKEKYFSDFLNIGVLLINPRKTWKKFDTYYNFICSEPQIVSNFDRYFHNEQNLFNVFFSHFLKDVKILDDTWNWIAPDIGSKSGIYADHFDPQTGNIVEWEDTGCPPPSWAHNFSSKRMYPYIYHFTGTNGAKDALKNYQNWK